MIRLHKHLEENEKEHETVYIVNKANLDRWADYHYSNFEKDFFELNLPYLRAKKALEEAGYDLTPPKTEKK